MAFRTPIDIAKRTCQQLEQATIDTFQDDSPTASNINISYDDLRLAELSRHTWAFSLRRARTRAISTTAQTWTPPTWSAVTTYTVGQVVMAAAGTYANSVIYPWILQAPTSLNQNPEITSAWSHFFGTMYADVFDSGATYAAGEIVIEPALYAGGTTYVQNAIVKDSNGLFWVSLAGGNTGHTPATSPTWWVAWVLPSSGQPPVSLNIVYQVAPTIWLSLVNETINIPSAPNTLPSVSPSTSWVNVGGTLQQVTILFPIGTGPVNNTINSTLYPLPFGWLRPSVIRLDSKQSTHPWLGALYGRTPDDFTYQSWYFTARGVGPYDIDFVADIADVSIMPPQFCESLAVRIGLEIDGVITGSKNTAKLNGAYKRITGEAMRIDMIVQGDPPNDLEELISVRF